MAALASLAIAIIAISYSQLNVQGATCEIVSPANGTTGPEFGLIFVPGAQLPGQVYAPLGVEIQNFFPGRLWIGLTEGYIGDYPNPGEINGAINDCMDNASNLGLSTTNVFHAGHSLGGVVLSSYIETHADKSAGILLYGSYIPDLSEDDPYTVYPVPVLTAMGTLDGAGISYLRRESDEMAALEAEHGLEGSYPTLAVDTCNHAQVASGPMPDIVIESDIDPELSNEECHSRYAIPAAAFMVLMQPDFFDIAEVLYQEAILEDIQAFTDDFLVPFRASYAQESNNGVYSPWIIQGQQILLNLDSDESSTSSLNVSNVQLSYDDLGPVKPSLLSNNCVTSVLTYSYVRLPLDPADAGQLQSAAMIKAKFKLEDYMLENLCLAPRNSSQCKDINEAALEYAYSIASDDARNRYDSKGRKLVPVDDNVVITGPQWLDNLELSFTETDPMTTTVQSISLLTGDTLDYLSFMHYCDLLSPYRALEWIYISSVVHGQN